MAYTKFGEFMRILRIKNHEIMGDIAKLLGVSTPFLSAVENGKKNIPAEWFDILVKHYNLTDEELTELSNAIENSKTQIKLNLSESSAYQRDAALQFARSFGEIDEDTAKKILELLKRSNNN
jgi:transcriptional regulator with XRE-family HTH domain